MRNTSLLLVLLSLWSVPAMGEPQPAFTRGVGNMMCADLGKTYASSNPNDAHYVMMGVVNWTMGYLSAFNSVNYANGKKTSYNLESATPEKIWTSVTSYCDQHPLAQVVNAIFPLLGALPLTKTPPATP